MRLNQLFTKIIQYVNQKYIIKHIDNKYWKLAEYGDGNVVCLQNEFYPELVKKYLPATDLEHEKKENTLYYNFIRHLYTKYAYKISNALIDPDYNWVIIGKNLVFRYSFPMAEDPWDAVKPRPSVLKFLTRKPPIELKKAILVKYSWGNYYHFFVDTLPQIMLCDKMGLDPDIPVIVPHNFPKIAFVQAYFKINPPKRKIIIQENHQYIRVKELYLAKDTFFSESIIELHKRLPGLLPPIPQKTIESPALIYVTRAKKYRRTILNRAEIEKLVTDLGFVIIEAADYDLEGQMRLFSNATHIVGIHGAALMNLLFCKNPDVQLLEIFPGKDLAPGHYAYLSSLLGYNYKQIIGDGLDKNSEFHLDKELFAQTLNDLVINKK